jgi:long-chain acyl-CoA synthetase
MKGYWNRPDETAGMIKVGADGERWLLTGDIAVMDDDGFFSIVDRKKEMILVSGFNVYPTELEAVLYRNPKVMKACVIGLPDETTGEQIKAYIVLREGMTATEAEMQEFLRDPEFGLTGYKIPKSIEFRDSLPETLVGKVLRRVLVEEEKAKATTG